MTQNKQPTGQLWVLSKGIFSRDLNQLFAMPGNVARRLAKHLRGNFVLGAHDGDARNLTEAILFVA